MSPQEFINDDFLAHPQAGLSASNSAPAGEQPPEPLTTPARGTSVFERANVAVSLVVGIGVLSCVAIAVYPLFSEISLPKDRHPLTLMLWLQGKNVTGEEYLRTSMEADRRKWDEMYRQSPVYQNSQFSNFQFDPNQSWSGNFQQVHVPQP